MNVTCFLPSFCPKLCFQLMLFLVKCYETCAISPTYFSFIIFSFIERENTHCCLLFFFVSMSIFSFELHNGITEVKWSHSKLHQRMLHKTIQYLLGLTKAIFPPIPFKFATILLLCHHRCWHLPFTSLQCLSSQKKVTRKVLSVCVHGFPSFVVLVTS